MTSIALAKLCSPWQLQARVSRVSLHVRLCECAGGADDEGVDGIPRPISATIAPERAWTDDDEAVIVSWGFTIEQVRLRSARVWVNRLW